MKTNYQKMTDDILKKIKDSGEKKRLLLHACCGPCSSYVIEYLVEYFEITVLYYNPNIYPPEEYNRRLQELKDFYPRFEPAKNVSLIEEKYDPQEFYSAIKIKEEPQMAKDPEKGERCRRCYEFRLKKAYNYAVEGKYDYFCTTLSISPFKDSRKLNIIGEELAQKNEKGPAWLYSDFKKKSGFLRSLELSEEYNLYRQEYCGCVYSIQTAVDESSVI